MNSGPIPAEPRGWFSSFSWDSFVHRFNLSTHTITEFVTYLGVGFILGFLIKKYLRSVLVAMIAMFLFIKAVEYTGVGFFVFNWDKFKELTGIAPTDTVDGVMRIWFAWAQTHVVQVVCAIIGFIFGTKVG